MNTQVPVKKINMAKAINMAVQEIKTELYDICSDLYSINETMFSEIYEKVTESYNLSTVDSLDDLRRDLKRNEFSDFMMDIMRSYEEDMRNAVRTAYKFVDDAPKLMIDICRSLTVPRNRKDILHLQKACAVTHRRIISQIEFFLKGPVQDFSDNIGEYIDSLFDSLEFIEEFNGQKNENEEEIYTESNDYEIKKIFDYKDMIKLAKDYNYEYKRSNGDHRIYEHKDTNKIIVIPAHSLGRGISDSIQKQIINNAS